MITGASFSADRVYRYRLWRNWNCMIPHAAFVMLNPSAADEDTNDPTVERCQERARQWNCGGLEVVNIFALRSTDPKALYGDPDPVGPLNDASIVEAVRGAKVVICAWGAHGELHGRGQSVRRLLHHNGVKLEALRINKDGTPAHPLYLPYSLQPVLMT